MSWWSEILGPGNSRIRQALQEGGVVIDVRTAYEFDQGHIPRSINIPVDRIKLNIGRIRDLKRPVIICCSGGGHCRDAVAILEQAGIARVINGGSWQSLWKVANEMR
jgi:phage shock protein E